MKKYIRGIFDTDGHLCLKNKEGKKYPVIGLASISLPLTISVRKMLDESGISSYLDTCLSGHKKTLYKIQISGKKNINLFFKLIGSSNLRNLMKYKEMQKI